MEGQQDWPYYSLGIAFQKNVGEATPTPPILHSTGAGLPGRVQTTIQTALLWTNNILRRLYSFPKPNPDTRDKQTAKQRGHA